MGDIRRFKSSIDQPLDPHATRSALCEGSINSSIGSAIAPVGAVVQLHQILCPGLLVEMGGREIFQCAALISKKLDISHDPCGDRCVSKAGVVLDLYQFGVTADELNQEIRRIAVLGAGKTHRERMDFVVGHVVAPLQLQTKSGFQQRLADHRGIGLSGGKFGDVTAVPTALRLKAGFETDDAGQLRFDGVVVSF